MKIVKDWRDRDWIWIISILLGSIIVILTWRLNDNDNVVNIISMFASGASIILAIVAIIQSTIYNSSSNELNAKMTEKLSILENNVELVKENILKEANEAIENAPIKDETKEQIKIDLWNNINYKSFKNNDIRQGYIVEKLIHNKFKSIYSNQYSITKERLNIGVDIILEDEFKKVFIKIEVWPLQLSEDITIRSILKFDKYIFNLNNNDKKVITPILIIVLNDHNELTNINSLIKKCKAKIVIFSVNELLNINNYDFKEKIGI